MRKMFKLIVKAILLFSLVVATLLIGSVIFSTSSDKHAIKMFLLIPGLAWGCWLAGNQVADTYREEKPF
ncbi:hypothetical protein LCGC14_0533590 [marine sediment metagenome]|uniref:Uncharacterized protein n=1 Tax=marine sediment metagenome TaxID=412755 RepID=A0A0F9RZR1_9ZZZZ